MKAVKTQQNTSDIVNNQHSSNYHNVSRDDNEDEDYEANDRDAMVFHQLYVLTGQETVKIKNKATFLTKKRMRNFTKKKENDTKQ